MVKMGDVWDRTVEFLGDNLSIVMPVVLIALFVPSSISGSLQDLAQSGGSGVRLGLAILSLGFSILSLWAQLAIVALAIDPAIGRGLTRVATARLLPAIGVFLLVALAFMVLALPVIVLLVVSGVDFTAMQQGRAEQAGLSAGYALALFLAFLVVLIAAIVLAARLLPLTGVIVAEQRGAGAITRALTLSRGLTWRLIGVVILYAVVALVAVLAAQTVFGSILRLVAGGDGPITIARIVTAVIVSGVSTAFTVLASAFCGKLYAALVRGPGAAAPHPAFS